MLLQLASAVLFITSTLLKKTSQAQQRQHLSISMAFQRPQTRRYTHTRLVPSVRIRSPITAQKVLGSAQLIDFTGIYPGMAIQVFKTHSCRLPVDKYVVDDMPFGVSPSVDGW